MEWRLKVKKDKGVCDMFDYEINGKVADVMQTGGRERQKKLLRLFLLLSRSLAWLGLTTDGLTKCVCSIE